MPTLGALVIGAALALFAATQIWVRGRLALEDFPGIAVAPTGRIVAPIVPAVGLLALGAALALLLVGRVGRALIGGLVALLSVLSVVASARVALGPDASVSSALAEAVGITALPGGTSSIVATATFWPWIAVSGATLTALAAVAAAVASPSLWPKAGRRYASIASTASTASTPEPSVGAAAAGSTAASDRDLGAQVDAADTESGVGLWDALDRGDDPTL